MDIYFKLSLIFPTSILLLKDGLVSLQIAASLVLLIFWKFDIDLNLVSFYYMSL